MKNQYDEFIPLFISECEKLLIIFDKIIMDSDAQGVLTDEGELFRVLHTLKGSSAMMGFESLVDLSHRFENIMSKIKQRNMAVTSIELTALVDVGIAFSKYFHKQLFLIQNGEPSENNEILGTQLDDLVLLCGSSAQNGHNTAVTPKKQTKVSENSIRLRVMLRKCPIPHVRAYIIAKSVKSLCSEWETEPQNLNTLTDGDDLILREGFEIHIVLNKGVDLSDVIEKISAQTYVVGCTVLHDNKNEKSTELSAHVLLAQNDVNSLIRYIDELTYEESSLESHIEKLGMNVGETRKLLSALKRTVKEVGVIASGMGSHSVDSVFMQMQITIRNMAQELNKDIRVQLSGTDIQVDKSVIDILSDCLIHIVRNSVDHGIELPQERLNKGKPKVGTISISATKKNDYLTVSVSDDGCGINHKDVLDRAEEGGLLKKPRDQYTSSEIGNLLFVSGVSTSKSVTQYSGRGVGLDTVIRRLNQIGGRVFVDSISGQGTCFSLKIPISLMIVDGIEVSVGEKNRFIVPTNSVMHISSFEKKGMKNEPIEYDGRHCTPLVFSGQSIYSESGGAFHLFLSPDIGPYYLNVDKISMISSYYVKPLPNCFFEKLGEDNVFSGCVLCANSQLLCVLDVEKMIATASHASTKGE